MYGGLFLLMSALSQGATEGFLTGARLRQMREQQKLQQLASTRQDQLVGLKYLHDAMNLASKGFPELAEQTLAVGQNYNPQLSNITVPQIVSAKERKEAQDDAKMDQLINDMGVTDPKQRAMLKASLKYKRMSYPYETDTGETIMAPSSALIRNDIYKRGHYPVGPNQFGIPPYTYTTPGTTGRLWGLSRNPKLNPELQPQGPQGHTVLLNKEQFEQYTTAYPELFAGLNPPRPGTQREYHINDPKLAQQISKDLLKRTKPIPQEFLTSDQQKFFDSSLLELQRNLPPIYTASEEPPTLVPEQQKVVDEFIERMKGRGIAIIPSMEREPYLPGPIDMTVDYTKSLFGTPTPQYRYRFKAVPRRIPKVVAPDSTYIPNPYSE
jgi:hypothetical protein